MKNFIACCALLGLMAFSCDNDSNEPDPEIGDCGSGIDATQYDTRLPSTPPKYPCDYMAAEKDGEDWEVLAETHYTTEGDTLGISGYNGDEVLGFKFVFTGTGTYQIASRESQYYFRHNAYYYTLVGGDVVTSQYGLSETGTVEVTEYIETENRIKGRFTLAMKGVKGSSEEKVIVFKEGKFNVHLPD